MAATTWYHFRQNNSGGGWDIDENVGQDVFIEAHDADEANARADEIGIYFDGVDSGQDCECCGDRWYPVSAWSSCGESMSFLIGCLPNGDWHRGDRSARYHRLGWPVMKLPADLIASYDFSPDTDVHRREFLSILGQHTQGLWRTQFGLIDILGQEARIRAHEAALRAKAADVTRRHILDMESE